MKAAVALCKIFDAFENSPELDKPKVEIKECIRLNSSQEMLVKLIV
jgi:hypothetical protein